MLRVSRGFLSIGIHRSLVQGVRCLPRQCTKSVVDSKRGYANLTDSEASNRLAAIAQTDLYKKLSKSPRVLEEFVKLQEIIVEKGFLAGGETPGVMAMIKMLSDKDLKNQLAKVHTAIAEEKIEISQEDVKMLSSMFGIKR
ncbi:hypothetical protein CANCADRAFT_32667 [Tortispora caseinolytica NRRL Y-17796]|uniref:Uncharacterized protein n=1 Tax=Tortispora caseinolytica NRRL Y-17796 TaxID=767744 RepID=A0A1E4TCA4_9ASCO|nr:hypothetical protein CANCADRAFT_32667 [Tortispora caseinolytica NRRL Y-17796]